jgi:AbrB family looped-hinge helix DNA binding protein
MAMKTKVTKRGQVSVPSGVRKKLQIGRNVTLEWIVEGATARIIPVPSDPVRAFRGSG